MRWEVRGTFCDNRPGRFRPGQEVKTMPQHPDTFARGLSVESSWTANGRWPKSGACPAPPATKRGRGVPADRRLLRPAGAASVYFYAFSTENWKRPPEEVGAIMKLFGEYLIRAFDYKSRNNRIVFLGDRTALEPRYQKLMDEIEADTADRTGMVLNIAVNYGGRQRLSGQPGPWPGGSGRQTGPRGHHRGNDGRRMYTAGQRDPDLILRPSGEKRLSNFMLWQAAYSELVEMDVLWPDFTPADLDAAIEEYNRRSRRFGGI